MSLTDALVLDSGHLQISQEVIIAQQPDLVLGLHWLRPEELAPLDAAGFAESAIVWQDLDERVLLALP